jgi:hypothetical protein
LSDGKVADAVVVGGGLIGLSGFMFVCGLMMSGGDWLAALAVAPIPALFLGGLAASIWFWEWAFPYKE